MDLAGEILRIFLVLALAWAMAWLAFRAPWRVPGIRGRRSRLKVVEAVGLGRQRLACILEVEGQRLLLGVSDGGVTLLKELGSSRDDEGVEAGSNNALQKSAEGALESLRNLCAAILCASRKHREDFRSSLVRAALKAGCAVESRAVNISLRRFRRLCNDKGARRTAS